MSNTFVQPVPRKRTSKLSWVVLLLGLSLAIGAFIFRQQLTDYVKLRNYQAPAPVVALAKTDGMTDYATKVFYVNHPVISEKKLFSSKCNNIAEQTIVLGCYHGGQNGIFLLSVTDQRLKGVEEVTAAHEMLHAAYDRLSTKERNRINMLLNDYYSHSVKDSRIRDTIDSYKQSEPNDLVNEMHSIFATEISSLPPELESYYAQYFSNRQSIVTMASTYSGEFTSRREQVAAYDAQLKTMKTQITTETARLKTLQSQLEQSRNQLESLKNSGDYTAYNAKVPTYNAQVISYNNAVTNLKQLIAMYNEIVAKRNAIALEVQALAKAISGDTVPQNQ